MATVTATYAPAAGRQALTLTSWAGSAAFAPTPTAGSQIKGPDALTIGNDGVITGPDGTYALHHITTAGVIESLSFGINQVVDVQGAASAGLHDVRVPSEWRNSDLFVDDPYARIGGA